MIVKAETKMKIPYYLEWNGNYDLKLSNGIKVEVHINHEKEINGNINIVGGFVQKDRYGRYNTTVLTCYFDCHYKYDIKMAQQVYQKELYHLTKKAVNKLLYVYRHVNEEYYINLINDIDIMDFRVLFIRNTGEEMQSINSKFGGGRLTLDSSMPQPNESIREMLKSETTFALWKDYLYKSKNSLELEEHSQGIVEINIALENYINTHLWKRLDGKVRRNDIKKFLTSQKYPPSIYSIVKYMYGKVPIKGYPLKYIIILIDRIRKNRNDIVHGSFNEPICKEVIESAIDSFEELVNISKQGPN